MADFNSYNEIASKMAFDPVLLEFDEFVRPYRVDINEKDFTFYEQGGKFRKIRLPFDQIATFFKYADMCRKAGVMMHWTEIQKPVSGLDIDIDIKQYSDKRLISDSDIADLVNAIVSKIFVDVFKGERGQAPTYCLVSSKPTLKPVDIYYKDGIHLRFSGLQLTKVQKKYILTLIKNSNILNDILGPSFKNDVSPKAREEYLIDSKEAKVPDNNRVVPIDVSSFIDVQSAHVPLVLLGCCKKDGKIPYKPYKLFKIKYLYSWTIEPIELDEKSSNFMLEYSVNHKLTTSIIQPVNMQLTSDAESKVLAMTKEPINENAVDTVLSDLDQEVNSMIANDSKAYDVKVLLDMLAPDRHEDHTKKWKVMIAVVNTGSGYKPLLEQFCRKKSSFEKTEFDQRYTDALLKRGQFSGLNYNTLENWAKMDSPIAYANLAYKQIKAKMFHDATDSLKHGLMSHTDIAEFIRILYGNQYATDYRKKQKVWFTFMTNPSMCRPGEMYKWREIEYPDNIQANLANILEPTFRLTMEAINNKIEQEKAKDAPDLGRIKFIAKAHDNVQKSYKCLGSQNFLEHCIKQSSSMFLQPGFTEKLDADPLVTGTENGCIQLSKLGFKYKIKEGYHGHVVSKYMPTTAVEFDPDDPTTQKLLLGQRALFQQDETDVYEWVMFDACRALDNLEKAALMLMVVGSGANGKTMWFVNIMSNVLGNDFVRSIPMSMIVDTGRRENAEEASSVKMLYKNLRAARYEESKPNEVLNDKFIKLIVNNSGQMTARDLFQSPETFKVKCGHVGVSNWKLIIKTKEHAMWRRIRFIELLNTFKEENDLKDPYDPKNPYHRKKDKTFTDEYFSSPEVKSKYLSILMFYHMKFYALYGGDLEKVYAPNLDRMTMAYRNSQDLMNVFLTSFLIVSPTAVTPIRESTIATGYLRFLTETYHNRTTPVMAEITHELRESVIRSVLEIDPTIGDVDHPIYHIKKGYRLAGSVEEARLEKGETYIDDGSKGYKKGESRYKPENDKEFLARIKREWLELLERDRKYNETRNPANEDEESDPLVAAAIANALPLKTELPGMTSASTSSVSSGSISSVSSMPYVASQSLASFAGSAGSTATSTISTKILSQSIDSLSLPPISSIKRSNNSP